MALGWIPHHHHEASRPAGQAKLSHIPASRSLLLMLHAFPTLEADKVLLLKYPILPKYVLRGPYSDQVTKLGPQKKSAMACAPGMLGALTILGEGSTLPLLVRQLRVSRVEAPGFFPTHHSRLGFCPKGCHVPRCSEWHLLL